MNEHIALLLIHSFILLWHVPLKSLQLLSQLKNLVRYVLQQWIFPPQTIRKLLSILFINFLWQTLHLKHNRGQGQSIYCNSFIRKPQSSKMDWEMRSANSRGFQSNWAHTHIMGPSMCQCVHTRLRHSNGPDTPRLYVGVRTCTCVHVCQNVSVYMCVCVCDCKW